MTLKFLSSALLAALVFVFVSAQQQDVTSICIGCICEVASGCNRTEDCNGDVCGPFHITRDYWADSGKPTIPGQSSTDDLAYYNCVTGPHCAARALYGYMARYRKDCNNDGYINCDDYVRIHFLGPYGCSGSLPPKQERAYGDCRPIPSDDFRDLTD